jgi:hypothetical protein
MKVAQAFGDRGRLSDCRRGRPLASQRRRLVLPYGPGLHDEFGDAVRFALAKRVCMRSLRTAGINVAPCMTGSTSA